MFGIKPVNVKKSDGSLDWLWIVILWRFLICWCKLSIEFCVESKVDVFKVESKELLIRLFRCEVDGQVVQWSDILLWLHWWQRGEKFEFHLCKLCGVGSSFKRILTLNDLSVDVLKLWVKLEIFWLLLI